MRSEDASAAFDCRSSWLIANAISAVVYISVIPFGALSWLVRSSVAQSALVVVAGATIAIAGVGRSCVRIGPAGVKIVGATGSMEIGWASIDHVGVVTIESLWPVFRHEMTDFNAVVIVLKSGAAQRVRHSVMLPADRRDRLSRGTDRGRVVRVPTGLRAGTARGGPAARVSRGRRRGSELQPARYIAEIGYNGAVNGVRGVGSFVRVNTRGTSISIPTLRQRRGGVRR